MSLAAAHTAMNTCAELRSELVRRGCDAHLSRPTDAPPLVDKVFTEDDGTIVRMLCTAGNAICYHAGEDPTLTKNETHRTPNMSVVVMRGEDDTAPHPKGTPPRASFTSADVLSEGPGRLATTAVPHAPIATFFSPTVMMPTTTDIITREQCVS